jgi:hypothetical protein
VYDLEVNLANLYSLDEYQELTVPSVNEIKAAEQRMHERNMLQSDW